MAKHWAAALPAIIGGLGLYQNAQAQKAQASLQQKGLDTLKPQTAAQKEILNLAENYQNGGQAKEDTAAVQGANTESTALLNKDLGALRSTFSIGGGSPTGDTEFGARTQDVVNRDFDPLRQFVAGLKSSQTARQGAMFNGVFNAPAGQIAGQYFQQANQNAPVWGPSLNLITQALQKAGQKAPGVDAASAPGATVGGIAGNWGSGSWDSGSDTWGSNDLPSSGLGG